MKKILIFSLLFFLALNALFLNSKEENKKLVGARTPALSPDGKQIAFSYMGDLWIVSSAGGQARRLTDHMAYDREPLWSPDGKSLAFTSNRYVNNDVFIMAAEGGTPVQLTFHTSDDVATGFSPDGQWVIFRSNRSSLSSIYKIRIQGGNAEPLIDTYWSWPYSAQISPDNQQILFSLGMENSFWWRRGYKGSNSSKIWVKALEGNEARLVIGDVSNCFRPAWSFDGNRIYFTSDREFGASNIWMAAKDGSGLKPVTRFKEKDVRWLSVASSFPLAAYERDFGIWLTDLKTGNSKPVSIIAPAESKENRSFFVENAPVNEFRLSPDGKKIAAVVRGEIFVLSEEGGYARNITQTSWRERDIDWDAESQSLVYVSDVDANPDLYIISALGAEKPIRLTATDEDELQPRFSPDGKWIAYYSGKRQIRMIQPDGKGDRLLVEKDFGGRFANDFSWSSDSRYLSIVALRNGNMDIFAVEVETGKEFLLTNTAYDENGSLWSEDGKYLIFSSNRYGHSFPEFTGKWDIFRVFLTPQKPEFDEDDFEKLFKPEEKEKKEAPENKKEEKAPVPVQLRLEDLDRQTETIVDTLGNDSEYVLSPKDSGTIYFTSNIDGRFHLWKTSLKKEELGRYEPFMAEIASPSQLQLDKKGENLYYLSRANIGKIELSSRKAKSISFGTKIQADKTADYEQMLGELYYTLQHYYYDEHHHQVNWPKIYQEFRPVLQQVREDVDFYDYANEMIGYLNSSHTGIRAPRGPRTDEPSAHVGAVWTFNGEKVILKRIIKDGPLYDLRESVAVGDELTAIDGNPVDGTKNIWKYLNGKQEKRLRLEFSNPKTRKKTEIAVKPISAGAENRLLLEEWIQSRREMVKSKTGDQVAYIYMAAMGGGDLDRFLKELERDAVPRKGLILDLRFNFGGNVHDRVLEALTKPVYAKWRMRGLSETPQSTFGLEHKPVVLLINEVTLSDGEMTSNGFKTLKRGPVVGNTTYGWLIFTTSVSLMNGGSFRLPFWGCYTLDGKDLETSGGVLPDIFIVNDLTHELKGEDAQLDKAIEKALELIK